MQPPRTVVARITAILSTFHAGSRHSVTEIARITGLPVSTTHRLAAEMAAWQLLQRSADGTYHIGSALRGLNEGPWSSSVLQERAPHVLTDLCDATGRRARLGVLRDGRVAYVEKRVGSEPVTAFGRGATLPAHATALGKALLAFAPSATVATLEQHLTTYTAHTLASMERLCQALRAIRLTKIALCQGELVAGDYAFAVPVFGPGGAIAAALEVEVADPRADFPLSRAALMVAARGLSRELSRTSGPARPHLRVVPAPPDSVLALARDHVTSASGG